ncbi:MAG: ATP-binding protein [Salinivirgaceae bacterium]|nr:ATP-binding protein [Salinivirgaceae bacterium]MDD4745646.1 ATP-binding protein [Salinivirgaceae bacterium]
MVHLLFIETSAINLILIVIAVIIISVIIWMALEYYFRQQKLDEFESESSFENFTPQGIFKKRSVFELLSEYLKNSPYGFLLYDKDLNLMNVNPAFIAITGYNKKTFITQFGTNLLIVAKKLDCDSFSLSKIGKREPFEESLELESTDGAKLHFKLLATPIQNNSGKFTNYALILIDISKEKENERNLKTELKKTIYHRDEFLLEKTEMRERINDLEKAFKKSSKHHIQLQKALLENEMHRKKIQEALDLINRQKDELERANAEIKEHSKMKELFLANTSHEIRTPLNAIIGFANLLLKEDFNSKQLRFLKNIKASSDNLLVVLNDILDISKIEAGKMSFEKIAFSLYELIDFLVSTIEIKAQEKNHKLLSIIDPEIPQVLIGDPTRLNQIMLNLLSNAIKFTADEGTIKCTLKVKGRTKHHIEIEFNIEDNGIGMSEEQLPHLFKAFTQAENSTTRKFGGTGLGLSIVKNLIELQDGEIFVKSLINQGTTFTFILPFGIGSELVIDKHGNKQITIEQHEAENIHILLVEDNAINQHLAVDTIKTWQPFINIDIAENGVVALEKLKLKNYSMVFMDIQMPLMDGNEATKQIRDGKIEGKENIPIIAMTAHALKDEKDRCLASGMNDYLTKPFVPEDLFYKIKYYGSQQVQTLVKAGKVIPSNINRISNNNLIESTDAAPKEDQRFENFTIDSLNKIYKGNVRQINKILIMYYDTVGTEIKDLKTAYENGDLQKTQNKAHALKPKMTYLGRHDIQEWAKNVEESIKQNQFDHNNLQTWINNISHEWLKIEQELKHYFKNDKNNES